MKHKICRVTLLFDFTLITPAADQTYSSIDYPGAVKTLRRVSTKPTHNISEVEGVYIPALTTHNPVNEERGSQVSGWGRYFHVSANVPGKTMAAGE